MQLGILPYEKVHILNLNNGLRIETYAIEGVRDSGVICLNGAAARMAEPGRQNYYYLLLFNGKRKSRKRGIQKYL